MSCISASSSFRCVVPSGCSGIGARGSVEEYIELTKVHLMGVRASMVGLSDAGILPYFSFSDLCTTLRGYLDGSGGFCEFRGRMSLGVIGEVVSIARLSLSPEGYSAYCTGLISYLDTYIPVSLYGTGLLGW